jgi:biopolymer transport protein ExbD
MARLNQQEVQLDMTPMIDMVFQLMIFFLVTIKMDQDNINPDIKLAMAPAGPAIEEKDPWTIVIEVDKRGNIFLAGTPVTARYLRGMLQNAVNRQGFGIPVLLRGDMKSRHSEIRQVLDVCSEVGLWRIKFAATKQQVNK